MLITLLGVLFSSLLFAERDHFPPLPPRYCPGLVLLVALYSATSEPEKKLYAPWRKAARNSPWTPGEGTNENFFRDRYVKPPNWLISISSNINVENKLVDQDDVSRLTIFTYFEKNM